MVPDWARESTEPVMFKSPEKRMPKPMAMLPTDLALRIKPPMISTMPRIRAMGASVEGWKKRSHMAPEASMSSRRMI